MCSADFANRLLNTSRFAAEMRVFFKSCVATVTLTSFPMALSVEKPLFGNNMIFGVYFSVMRSADFANRLFNASRLAAEMLVFFKSCVAAVAKTSFPMAFTVKRPISRRKMICIIRQSERECFFTDFSANRTTLEIYGGTYASCSRNQSF